MFFHAGHHRNEFLFDGIDHSCSLSRARIEELNLDYYFQAFKQNQMEIQVIRQQGLVSKPLAEAYNSRLAPKAAQGPYTLTPGMLQVSSLQERDSCLQCAQAKRSEDSSPGWLVRPGLEEGQGAQEVCTSVKSHEG